MIDDSCSTAARFLDRVTPLIHFATFYASVLIAQNRDLKTLQVRMGHEDAR